MANVYDNAMLLFLTTNTLDLDDSGATYRIMLLQSSETFDSTNVNVDDLSNEVAGSTRQTLSNLTVTTESNEVLAKADAVIFPTGMTDGQTIGAAVIYKFVSDDTDSILVCWIDLSTRETDSTRTFELRFDASDTDGTYLKLRNA